MRPQLASSLAGLSTRIYQTVHDGALAFLVVVSGAYGGTQKPTKLSENAGLDSKSPRLDTAEDAGPNPAEPIVLFTV